MKLADRMEAMTALTTFDDAYVDDLAKAFGDASFEDVEGAFEQLRTLFGKQTPEQKECVYKLNKALAERPAFCTALNKYNAYRVEKAKAATGEAPAITEEEVPDGDE